MVAHAVTIERMAKKKANQNEPRPQGRSPAYTVFARIPPDLGAALEAYIASVKLKPSVTVTVTVAIEEFLASRGFWPRTTQEGK